MSRTQTESAAKKTYKHKQNWERERERQAGREKEDSELTERWERKGISKWEKQRKNHKCAE